jgi:hypothetical protein
MRTSVCEDASSGPDLIYRSGPNRGPTSQQCTNNRWLTTRVDDATGDNERLRLITLDVTSD